MYVYKNFVVALFVGYKIVQLSKMYQIDQSEWVT